VVPANSGSGVGTVFEKITDPEAEDSKTSSPFI
jgi:hypothetical protein